MNSDSKSCPFGPGYPKSLNCWDSPSVETTAMEKNQEISEKIETFQNLLISYATVNWGRATANA
jgi:hypothetical protein